MKAAIVPDIHEATEPGSVEIRRWPSCAEETGVAGLAIRCPGCNQESWLPVRQGGRWWKLEQLDPLTITPSVFHTEDAGGCGWHGWLKSGEWVSV